MLKWSEAQKNISAITVTKKRSITVRARLVSELVNRRQELGLDQLDVALAADITQPSLCRIESGRSIPRLDTLEKIGLAMGLNLKFVPFEKEDESDD